MMKPVVLRFSVLDRSLALALWGLVGAFLFLWFGQVKPWTELLSSSSFWVCSILWALLCYSLVFIWNYKLIFGNTHLLVKTIWFPFFKPFSCAYEDIQWVLRWGSWYSVKIVLTNEQILMLRTRFLEGGEEKIIAELKARIKPEKIMSEVEVLPSLWNNPKYTNHQKVVNLVSVLIYSFFGFYFNFFVLLPNYPFAWEYIKDAGVATRLDEYSIDGEDSVWTLDRKIFDHSGVVIRHITGNKVKSWDFTSPSGEYPHKLVGDGHGNPWIFDITTTFHWENGQWIEIPYPITVAPIDLYWSMPSYDGKVWTLLVDENAHPKAVFQWNLANNESTVIDLPQYDDATHAERLRLMPDGTLVLLRTYAQLGVVELHQLVNQAWEKVLVYSAPENINLENVHKMDATLDRSAQFWFLFPMVSGHGYYVQRFNAQTNIWETTKIANTEVGMSGLYYRFEVDFRNRVWVSGFDNTIVFLPQWDEAAKLLVYYNFENSGVLGGQLWLAPDGKMWHLTTLIG